MNINKKKLKEWWDRYALAEFLGLIGTVIFAYWTYKTTWNQILAAYMWAIWENIGYYWTILTKELLDKSYTGTFSQRLWKRTRNILFEFGIPELFDFFLVRPFFLYITPQLVWNYIIWIIIWKFLAEIIFYWGTIFLYELRKKLFDK